MTNMKKSSFSGHVMAMICIVFWGVSFIVSKKLMIYITPIQLMWIRFLVAYIALWVMHPKWHFSIKTDLFFLATSLFGNTLYFLTENNALQLTQASNVSILVSIAPILSLIVERISGNDERFSRNQKIGSVTAFAGVVLVVFNGIISIEIHLLGDCLAISSALCWAIYCVMVKRVSEEFNNFMITRKIMFYAFLTCTPIVFANGKLSNFSGFFTAENILGLLFLGCICSAACYVLWNASIKNLGILKTNIYIYAIPLVTLVAGTIFLNEHISAMGFAGFVLIIGGMIAGNRTSKTEKDSR